MVVDEEFKSVWDGGETIAIVTMKTDGNNLFVQRRQKSFPWKMQWELVVGNWKEMVEDYQEKKLLKFSEGVTEDRVRVYPYDLANMNKNSGRINVFTERNMRTLETERDFYFQASQEMMALIRDASMEDLLKARMKDDYDFYVNKLKPNYTYNKDKDDKSKKS